MNKWTGHWLGTTLAGLALAVAGPVAANEDEPGHQGPHAFHEMMEELGEATEDIVDAINHENWPLVAQRAGFIADHPRPPVEERRQLHRFLGDRQAAFARHDRAVHEAAATVARFAEAGEGRDVITAFADLQKRCLDCHTTFRQDFREHFYSGNH